jgi:dipeptidyl aminopeptidase/acylaminoacyl peptidase
MALIACSLSPTGPSTSPATVAASTPTPALSKTRVTFENGSLTLVGYLYKPAGDGTFPAVVWNHGNEQDPASGSEIDAIADILVPAGYVVFAPLREGQGGSQGASLQDQVQQKLNSSGASAAQQLFVQLMEGSQLDDQLAGLAYLKSLPYVDPDRLAVAGCSYGGIQAILAAEKSAGYKAAVAISPGSESWDGNTLLQQDLTKAVSSINIPVFLLHPEKDVSVAPGYALAQEFLRLKKSYGLKIYPPFGPDDEQGLCFGDGTGFHWFAPDMLSFLANAFAAQPGGFQPPAQTQSVKAEKITLQSDGLSLVGYVYKPQGPGPFPGIIWNHGSEDNPTESSEFDGVASLFVAAGYVVVDPVRRGQGGSQGTYISDDVKQYSQAHGHQAGLQYVVQLFGSTQLDDELAGLTYMKSLSYVDPNRIAVVGCSYGGIMSLLGAESGAGYKAAVALSPGAESWANPNLQKRLLQAVDNIKIPTLILHPAQDASLLPGLTMGPEFQQLGKPYGLQIFPPFGGAVEHCFGGGGRGAGFQVFGPDALMFLSNVLH